MITVRAATIDEIRPLRHAVLRAGRDFATTLFPEDARPDARHFAALTPDGEIAAIASLYLEARSGGASNAWRLRGMASAQLLRGQGYGSAVLRATIGAARELGLREIWCNAREVAFAFYQAHGFELVGGFFEIPKIGLHKVMFLALA